MVQPIFSLLKMLVERQHKTQPIQSIKNLLIKRQYGSAHVVFTESFDQKTMQFNGYSLLRKF